MPEATLRDTAITVPPDALVSQATPVELASRGWRGTVGEPLEDQTTLQDPRNLLSFPQTAFTILRAIDQTNAQATQMLLEASNPDETGLLGILTTDSARAANLDKVLPSRPKRTHKLLAYCHVIHRSTPLPFLREAED